MKIYQVDAFTDKPFTGNPAGVCVLSGPKEDAWMQNVAREMNLSETAFLLKQEDGHRLRWFTPAVEVELCGHATLASAHILWETGLLAAPEIARFHTLSGLLTANAAETQSNWISPPRRTNPRRLQPGWPRSWGEAQKLPQQPLRSPRRAGIGRARQESAA